MRLPLPGSVPVYLGDSRHLKTLLPDPLAVIFVEDFANLSLLSQYLQDLLRNETAYERHRQWRQNFSSEGYRKGKPLLERSWQCRICHWAAEQYQLSRIKGSQARGIDEFSNAAMQKNTANPTTNITHKIMNRAKKLLPEEQEGTLYRPSNQRGVESCISFLTLVLLLRWDWICRR